VDDSPLEPFSNIFALLHLPVTYPLDSASHADSTTRKLHPCLPDVRLPARLKLKSRVLHRRKLRVEQKWLLPKLSKQPKPPPLSLLLRLRQHLHLPNPLQSQTYSSKSRQRIGPHLPILRLKHRRTEPLLVGSRSPRRKPLLELDNLALKKVRRGIQNKLLIPLLSASHNLSADHLLHNKAFKEAQFHLQILHQSASRNFLADHLVRLIICRFILNI
jgi:hypothetical protein